MRRFDACALCLNSAREPVACNEGHLFCKECAYTDLRELYDFYLSSFGADWFSFSEERYPTTKKQIGRYEAGG